MSALFVAGAACVGITNAMSEEKFTSTFLDGAVRARSLLMTLKYKGCRAVQHNRLGKTHQQDYGLPGLGLGLPG